MVAVPGAREGRVRGAAEEVEGVVGRVERAAVVVFATEAPAYAQRAWTSLHEQLATVGYERSVLVTLTADRRWAA